MQFFQHVKEQYIGSSDGTYSVYWVTQTKLGSCICSCHPLSCNLKNRDSLPTSSDTWRQKTQKRYCMVVMIYLLQALLGRGQGGGGNTSCKLHRRPRQALAYSNATAGLKDATFSVLPQGVQYFRLMGTHFSDTSKITYAVPKQQRPPTRRWMARGMQHPEENQTGPYLHLTFPHLPSSLLPRAVTHSTGRATKIRALTRQLHFVSPCGEWVPNTPDEFHGGVKTHYINCKLIYMIYVLKL